MSNEENTTKGTQEEINENLKLISEQLLNLTKIVQEKFKEDEEKPVIPPKAAEAFVTAFKDISHRIDSLPRKMLKDFEVPDIDYKKSLEEGEKLVRIESIQDKDGNIVSQEPMTIGSIAFTLGRIVDTLDTLDEFMADTNKALYATHEAARDTESMVSNLLTRLQEFVLETRMRFYANDETIKKIIKHEDAKWYARAGKQIPYNWVEVDLNRAAIKEAKLDKDHARNYAKESAEEIGIEETPDQKGRALKKRIKARKKKREKNKDNNDSHNIPSKTIKAR